MASIAELLDTVLPAGTAVLAGSDRLTRPISSVQLMRARPPGLSTPRAGDLILVSLRTLRALDATLTPSALVRSLGGAVAALLIQGAVPSDAAAAAERLSLPLLRLPPEPALTVVEGAVLRYLAESRAEWYRVREDISRQLTALAVQALGLPALAECMGRMTGQAVLFEARGEEVAFYLPPELTVEQREQIQAHVAGDRTIPEATGVLRTDAQVVRLSTPVRARDAGNVTVSLLGPAAGQGERARLVLEAGAMAAAIELAREQAVRDTVDRIQGSVLGDLIHGEGDPGTRERRAERLGYDLAAPRVALAFTLDPVDTDSAAGSIQTLNRHLTRVMSDLEARAPIYTDDGLLVVFYPVAADLSPAARRRLAERLRRDASVAVPTCRLRAGLSSVHAGASSFRGAYREACQALEMGFTLAPDRDVISFEDLGVYRLLLSIPNRANMEDFCRQHLGALERHDRERNSQLIPTLDAYLRSGTVADAARQLNLHRNTLRYRLRRVREIADVDLDDPEARFTLQLALHARAALTLEPMP